MPKPIELMTIGYEKATQPAVVEALRHADVELVVDVRAVSASRRPGFSKRQLAAGLEEAGIDYLHMRALGTPAEGREASRKGRYDDLRSIYERHLALPESQAAMIELRGLVLSGRRLCLLCLEHDPTHCHRSLIIEQLPDIPDLAVHHLNPSIEGR